MADCSHLESNGLPALEVLPSEEKGSCYDFDAVYDKEYMDSEKADGDTDVVLIKGEPVVTNGRDVSRFVVDLRDDGDNPLTFRSIFLGTVFAGLSAALSQVIIFIGQNKQRQ